MKKKKLSLTELSVNSFITAPIEEKKTINGAAILNTQVLKEAASYLFDACIIATPAEATPDVAKIVRSLVQSNQGRDCTGYSRVGCNLTGPTEPCNIC